MKRLLCFLLCALLVLSLAACGQKNEGEVIEGTAMYDKTDVDLTTLSTTMLYSELTNIMNAPSSYEGKTVKIKGQFGISRAETGTYYLCNVSDVTACCSQGLEFVLKDSSKYPAEGTEITVKGKFATYQEQGNTYCHLEDAEIL